MSLLLYRDYVANTAAPALNVGGLRRSLHYRGMPTVLELFRRAIQRKQFKSDTYSNVKVHLFGFPIRFADLTIVNLSPANFSPSLLLRFPPPLSPPSPSCLLLISFSFRLSRFITAHANLVRSKCQLRASGTRQASLFLHPTSPRGGVPAVVTASFTFASGIPKID